MMLKRTQCALLAFVLVVVLALAIPVPVFAQSCAMCYTAAAKSGPQMIRALKSGILILFSLRCSSAEVSPSLLTASANCSTKPEVSRPGELGL